MGGFRKALLGIGLVLLSARFAHAKIFGPTPVQVSCACEDPGGKAYLQAVHEMLASSARFREVTSGQTTTETILVKIVSSALIDKGMPRTGLSIVCMHNGERVLIQDIETCNQYPAVRFVQAMLAELGAM